MYITHSTGSGMLMRYKHCMSSANEIIRTALMRYTYIRIGTSVYIIYVYLIKAVRISRYLMTCSVHMFLACTNLV